MKDGRLFFFDLYDQEHHILIDRVQMEQDTAKITIKDGQQYIDFNRSGVPLLEINTRASWTNPEDCKLVVRELQELLQSLEVSDARIALGSLRVDVNLSVHGKTVASPEVEIKNISSAKNVERAVEFEYRRQV